MADTEETGEAAARGKGKAQHGEAHTRSGGPRSRAAAQANAKNSMQMTVPVIGQVTLPPADELAFIGGLGALAVFGVVDWPVAVAVGIGHVLVRSRQSKTLQAFGEALEQAREG